MLVILLRGQGNLSQGRKAFEAERSKFERAQTVTHVASDMKL